MYDYIIRLRGQHYDKLILISVLKIVFVQGSLEI